MNTTTVKIAASLFFIFVYLAILLRPYLPFIEYELNKGHISTQLCVNRDKPQMHCEGKCHLKKQLQKANGTAPESPEPQNRTKTIDNQWYLLVLTPNLHLPVMLIFAEKQWYTNHYRFCFLPEVFRPPKPLN